MAQVQRKESTEEGVMRTIDSSEPYVSATHDWPFPKAKDHRAEVISMLENHKEIVVPDQLPGIIHIRDKKKNTGHPDYGNPSNVGGATIAYNVDGNGRLWAAVAFNRGNFCKAIQRRNALLRLENGVMQQVDCFHVESVTSCLRRWFDETFKMGW